MLCLWLASVLSLFQLTVGVIVNTTVDDQNGGPDGNKILYLPDTGWLQGGIGNCGSCLPPPVSNFAYMNTFHGSLFNQRNQENTSQSPPTATLVFFGRSVSVNCILSNALSNPAGTSDMTFTIDGIQASTFSHTPAGNSDFQASTVFISEPLQLGNHTLVIQNGRTGGGSSLVLLDSVTYSFDDLSTTSTSAVTELSTSATPSGIPSSIGVTAKRSSTATIVGGVVGALAVAILAILLVWLRFRRVRRLKSQQDPVPRTQSLRIENYPLHTRQVGDGAKRSETAFPGLSTSTALLLGPREDAGIPEASRSPRPAATEPAVIISADLAERSTIRNLRLVEQRLATLEAQVVFYQQPPPPPPYIQDDNV
ncbi:hypothetical protein MVEN_01937400 [Mycena venus]|uniref:Uncharacterized protein n=1 Tax=Mycena venus TaxID=2733690 RepID=A0A8H6XEY2_9AGAR|nr:hypothetical protein MVEN_01937400 [Mycena venus]